MVQDKGPAVSAVTIILVVLSTVFVAARFFTRGYLVRRIKQDDWWILAAWLVAVGFSTSICVAVHFGLGKHRADIPDASFAMLRKAEYSFSILYNPALMLTKTSIIIFYISVMSKDVDPVFKWCNWITLAVVNVAGLALTLYNLLQCIPVPAGWTYPTPTTAKCTDIVTLYLSSAPVNIITDVAILLLPMPILTGMRLPKKQKIILIVTFSFGGFVAVIDVVRLAYLQDASVARLQATTGSGGSTRAQDNTDFSWNASLSFMWSAVEVNLGIICACVPSLKPLFMRFLPQFIKNEGDTQWSSPEGSDAGVTRQNTVSGKGDISMVNHPAAFRKPTVKEYAGSDDGDNMGFLNMLAGPDEDAPDTGLARTKTKKSLKRTTTAASDFDFVSMGGPKNMLKLTNRQSVWPIAVVTVIFFLWGFAYGLLDSLNSQFQRVTNLSAGQSLGLHAAYFGAYLVGPLTLGQFILKKYGFRAAMMVGLCIYGCGTLVFWPSAVLTSYTAFVISNFIVAFGLSCLEIAANPYIALCGPLEYAEVRLNLSQAFQAVGSVLSPLLANKALFRNINAPNSLVNVQWAYLGISLFVWALAIVFYYIPLPEATDDELEEQADKRSAAYRAHVGPFKVVYVTLGLGVFSQWCYVGAQECIGANVQDLLTLYYPNASISPSYYHTVGQTCFALGRFSAAFLNYIAKPRWILIVLWGGFVIGCGVQMAVTGAAAAGIQMMIFTFEAGIFSIIFAISMRGLGSYTKMGSAFMTAGISGGAVSPVIQWAVSKGHGLKYSYCVPLATAAFGMIFAFYLNLVPAARNQVDPVHEDRTARREKRALKRQDSTTSTNTANQFGLGGILARRRKEKQRTETPTAEHIERQSQAGTLRDSPTNGLTEKEEDIVQLKAPQGLVGALEPWGGDEKEEVGESSASASSSANAGQDDIIKRHRPVWDEKGDDDDDLDYHAMMRKM